MSTQYIKKTAVRKLKAVRRLKMKNVWSIIALILVIIGGLNWMVVGIFNFNVVDWVFAMVPCLATVVYILVGLAAIYMIVWLCFAGSARRAKKDYSYSNNA